jgi:sodium transport system permease protein
VCIALPAVLMAMLLTGRPLKTLLLDRAPSASACVAAVLLALLLHPLGLQLMLWIKELYPIQEELLRETAAFGELFALAPNPWLPYVLIALLPAICEELAFRGFILSGLRNLGSKWWAIAISAICFGLVHAVIQQSLSAAAIGLIIGYVAVQTGSLIPCILFHVTYNSVMFATAQLPAWSEVQPVLKKLFEQPSTDQILYAWPITLICGMAAAVLLGWFRRLPYQASREERISDARSRQAQHPLASGLPGNSE